MTDTTELQEMLQTIEVSCDNVEYGFTTVPKSLHISTNEVLGSIQEEEGVTILATKAYMEDKGIIFEGPFAKLIVQASVPIGFIRFTAALAGKLADKGVPANIVSAYNHNIIFIPYDLREQAAATIEELKR
jgi:hypothetical protein